MLLCFIKGVLGVTSKDDGVVRVVPPGVDEVDDVAASKRRMAAEDDTWLLEPRGKAWVVHSGVVLQAAGLGDAGTAQGLAT
jgi:hypothetical protein